MRRISASISSRVTEGPNHHQRIMGRLSAGGATNDRRIAPRPGVAAGWADTVAVPARPRARTPTMEAERGLVTWPIVPRVFSHQKWGTTSLMKPRKRLLVAGASSVVLYLLAPATPRLALARTEDAAVEAAGLRSE